MPPNEISSDNVGRHDFDNGCSERHDRECVRAGSKL